MRVLTSVLLLFVVSHFVPEQWFFYVVVALLVGLTAFQSGGMGLRRKAAIASWTGPNGPEIYAKLAVDCTKVNEQIEAIRARTPGAKVTLTHFVGKALGAALRDVPTLNGRLVFGRFVPNPTIDICFLAAVKDDAGKQNLAYATIKDIPNKPIESLAEELSGNVQRLRSNTDKDFKANMDLVKFMPTFLLHGVVRLVSMLSNELGIAIPSLGIKARAFGGATITNVGVFGIEEAFAPLIPMASQPCVVLVGAMVDKPVVVDGKIVIRPMVNICATMDHRYVDGADGSIASGLMKKLLEESPEKLL